LQKKVHITKLNSKNPSQGLTEDESAAIRLYTMQMNPAEKSIYYLLNETLRSEDRQKLIPWFSYLKLILVGLYKLPPVKRTIWRGIKMDLSEKFLKKSTFIWWGFSSCTESLEVLESEQFLGKQGTRTLFNIECENGRMITQHSYFKKENEILLLPATVFEVIGKTDVGNSLHIVQVKETKPLCSLLQDPNSPAQQGSHGNDSKEMRYLTIHKRRPYLTLTRLCTTVLLLAADSDKAPNDDV
ncbi:unnamed protein product, partial [Didymodactylos carnosus]